MSFIQFDKTQLVNLSYSLKREHLRANHLGDYASTTLVYCNTRKYHGLLICPQPLLDGNKYLFLSNVEETLIVKGQSFNLSINKFPGGVYYPKGHKYIDDCRLDPNFKITFKVGGATLLKENILLEDEERMLIRYTLLDSNEPLTLKLRPLLAFRNIHSLSKANCFVETKYTKVENGIRVKMYTGFSHLYMQLSKKNDYIHTPDWCYNVEYLEEQERGYDFQEDLYFPGYFEIHLKKGESVVFSAGLSETSSKTLNTQFNKQITKRLPSESFEKCLTRAAKQFIVKNGKKTEVIAGFPWFDRWGRDTFIALPGLTLSIGDEKTCKQAIDTMVSELKGPLFPNIGSDDNVAMNSVDAPLWFFWTLQQYADYTKSHNKIWKEYGKKMQLILNGYRDGTEFNIKMQPDGLISAGLCGIALTWMDAIVAGKPVTPRIGKPVEINALWYNAVMFSLQSAKLAKDNKFIDEWKHLPELIQKSFIETFWYEEKGYLFDYVNGDEKNWFVRPNQIFATSLPYVMLDEEKRKSVLKVVERELLTSRGLRTLSPKNLLYKGRYCGGQAERDGAYHQGTVWPWLLGHFAEGYLKIHGKSAKSFIKKLIDGFKEDINIYGIGTICEVYDGDPPHNPGGTISQAWSVAEILRINKLLEEY